MTKKTIHLLGGALLLGATSQALGAFGLSLTLTSDYVWRGVSQTLGDPAIQGSVDYEHDSGFYAGVWASNVDFFDEDEPGADPDDDDGADVEIDYTLGFAGEFENGLGWDVGVIFYTFPGADDDLLDDSEEVYLGVSYELFSATVYHDFDNDTTYLEGGVSVELPADFTLGGRVGYFDLDEGEDYADFQVSLSRTLGEHWEVDLSYTDTDMSDSECEDFSGYDDLCDGRVVFSITASM